MWAALAAIGGLLLLGFKVGIFFYKKRRTKPTYDEDIRSLHNSIAKGDANTLSDLFDELRRPPCKSNRIGQDDKEAS